MQLFNPHETARLKELDGVKLASFPRRSTSFLIDLFISVLLSSALLLSYEYINGRFNTNNDIKIDFNFENWYSIVATVIYFGLTTYFGNGKTLGKKLLKIRVVSITHPQMTLWQSIERALGYGASILEGGFGFIQFFINPNRRTVHDRIAETIVVDEGQLSLFH
jgi:uncharacterized RDD family membrane protein YckC